MNYKRDFIFHYVASNCNKLDPKSESFNDDVKSLMLEAKAEWENRKDLHEAVMKIMEKHTEKENHLIDLSKECGNTTLDDKVKCIKNRANNKWQIENGGDLVNNDYVIERERLDEDDWILHMLSKGWCDMNDFIPRYFEALESKGIKGLKIRIVY